MDTNRVTVKIYGQEYNITGKESREHIIKVADHVDMIMRDTSNMLPKGSATSLAVLTAVNIASELFVKEQDRGDLRAENDQLKRDIDHYINMWEEAKKNFLQYKEDAQALTSQKEEMQRSLDHYAAHEHDDQHVIEQKDERIAQLERKMANLLSRLKEQEAGETSNFEQIKELEGKYKELEGNYFDLQMENIQLKGEIDRYKKIVE